MKKGPFFLYCCLCLLPFLGWGQCTPSLYYIDRDGDGFGEIEYSDYSVFTVYSIYYDFNELNFPFENVILSCSRPYGYSETDDDLDDSDPCIGKIPPKNFYRDADGDGFGDPSNFTFCSIRPTGYVADNTDCDDSDASIHPRITWFPDADEDGVGTDEYVFACYQPDGHVAIDGDDCDNNADTLVRLTWYRDQDGDGVGGSTTLLACVQPVGYVASTGDACDLNAATLVPLTWYRDQDGDGTGGTTTQQACAQPTGYVPSSGDICDNDASTLVERTWFQDEDGDGFAGTKTVVACTAPPDHYPTSTDCDDEDPNLNPNTLWYLDSDGDGFGGSTVFRGCVPPSDHVSNTLDRDDSNPCITDSSPIPYFEDFDGDGYGNPLVTLQCSAQPIGYVTNNTDCDDNNDRAFPGTIWYRDADGDGYGANSPTLAQCTQPSGYVGNRADYDDSNENITNIAPQHFYRDNDGDGYGNPGVSLYYSYRPSGYVTNNNDCEDTDAQQHDFSQWYIDQDGDGKGYNPVLLGITNSLRSTPDHHLPAVGVITSVLGCLSGGGSYVKNSDDYDDMDPNISDIIPQFSYDDNDGDGYGDPNSALFQSSLPTGHVTNNNDCDDTDAQQHDFSQWYIDQDGDGKGFNPSLLAITNSLRSSPTFHLPATGVVTSVMGCVPSGGTYVKNSDDYDDLDPQISSIIPQFSYDDNDGDGYGDPNAAIFQSSLPTGNVTNKDDCNDNDSLQHNYSLWYIDQDGDGKGFNPSLLAITNSLRSSPTFHLPATGVVTSVMGCIPSGGTYVKNSDDYDDLDSLITEIQPHFSYKDADGDGYGNAFIEVFQSNTPLNHVTNNADCDDTNALLHPLTVWYLDADGDGWGSDNFVQQCLAPTGYVSNTLDFNDTTEHITHIAPQNYYQDSDSDGYGNPAVSLYYSYQPTGYLTDNSDCNDSDANIHPLTVWYADTDGDGYGTKSSATTATTQQCTPPFGFVHNNGDYDDTTANIINIIPQNFYQDADGDGYGNPLMKLFYSLRPTGYVTNASDCNDNDKYTNPQKTWYQDKDGDGLGDPNFTTTSCVTPTNYVDNNGDLSDTSQYITNIATRTFYYDNDGDGFGDPGNTGNYSFAPPNYTINMHDCNDHDNSIHPNTIWYQDVDGDGFGGTNTFVGCIPPTGYLLTSSDLDDNNFFITNIPPQFFYNDKDLDGYGDPLDSFFASQVPNGYVLNNTDCNDNDPSLHPQTQWYEDNDNDGHGGALAYVGCEAPGNQVRLANDFDDSTAFITNIPPRNFYQDSDGDNYGNPNISLFYSKAPNGYVDNADDCDDQNDSLHPDTIWYADTDGDSFGDATVYLKQCLQPNGYVRDAADIDDTTPFITNIPPQYFYRDADEDGFGTALVVRYYSLRPDGFVVEAGDCDDQDNSLHPNTPWYADTDGDGFGDAAVRLQQCLQPDGYVRNAADIDDSTAFITDIPPQPFYRDDDGDGYGDPQDVVVYSILPPGYVVQAGDCNDQDSLIHPNTVWYADTDGDSFGDASRRVQQCFEPIAYVQNPWDLDDTNEFITNIPPQTFYRDEDGDGFGTDQNTVYHSTVPLGYVVEAGDCDDQDPLLHPNTHWYIDDDEDGYGGDLLVKSCEAPTGYVTNTLDLDDTNEHITDQATRTFYFDNDGDGFGAIDPPFFFSVPPPNYVVNADDCDDFNKRVHAFTEWFLDADGDGFGVDEIVLIQCEQPEGYALYSGDCNDENPNQVPGASCAPTNENYADPEEEQSERENVTGIVYADRDLDGFGDPDESYPLENVEELLFGWVNDMQDACPEEYGEIKGCPKPLVLKTQITAGHNQIIRLFEQDSIGPDIAAAQEAFAEITDTQLAQVETYPNPTEGIYHAVWDFPVQEFMGRIAVYTYPELLLIEDFPFTQQPMAAQLDFNGLDPGIYFVQFYFIDGRTLTRRIVKR